MHISVIKNYKCETITKNDARIMKRKLIKQGQGTLTVTVPSSWVEKYHLKPGTDIDIIEQANTLIISPTELEERKKISISLDNLSSAIIWRMVSSAYRAGYHEIKVSFIPKKHKEFYNAFTYNTVFTPSSQDGNELSQIEVMQSLVNRFIGMEIIDQGADYCVIREMGSLTSKEVESTIRRIFLLLQSMTEAVLEGAKGNKEGLKSVHLIDTNLDRFEDYCIRVLNRIGYTDYNKTKTAYAIVFLLELVGDEYKRLAEELWSSKKVHALLLDYIILQNKKTALFYELYYKYSVSTIESIYKKDAQEQELFSKLVSHVSEKEIEILHRLKKIGRYIMSLTELRIDMEYA